MLLRYVSAFAGLLFTLFHSLPSHALSYRVADANLPGQKGPCTGVIIASGTITQREHLYLAEFLQETLRQRSVCPILVIESPGGFNVGAASLGLLARRLKMTVMVAGWTGETITTNSGLRPSTCASACVLVLAGGSNRYIVSGSRVGVHRSHTGIPVLDPLTRQSVSGTVDNAGVKSAYASYFKQMGVGQGLADVMDKTDSSTMYWLSEQEMSKFKLAVNVSRRRQR